LSRIIEIVLMRFPDASGVYHVSSASISKYELLTMIRDRLKRPVEILPDETFQCDRSLDSIRFRREFGYTPPTWNAMIDELVAEFGEAA
jgi:dTDP-4-dehydrorhamnose reductase